MEDESATYVSFKIEEECFAIPSEMVKEIIHVDEFLKIHETADYLMGIFSDKGKVYGLINVLSLINTLTQNKTPHTSKFCHNCKAILLKLVDDDTSLYVEEDVEILQDLQKNIHQLAVEIDEDSFFVKTKINGKNVYVINAMKLRLYLN